MPPAAPTPPADPAHAQPPANLATLRADAIRLLEELEPTDEREREVVAGILAHLAAHPDAWWRWGPTAHLTAGVLVLSPDLGHVLLTHHRKARTWFQLGGHAEAGDADVLAVATREAREESGMPDLVVAPVLVDVDRHALGGGFTRCTEHLDLRFAAVAPRRPPVVSEESLDVAWWPVDALPSPHGEEIPRLVANARRRLGLG